MLQQRGMTVLHHAAQSGQVEFVNMLILLEMPVDDIDHVRFCTRIKTKHFILRFVDYSLATLHYIVLHYQGSLRYDPCLRLEQTSMPKTRYVCMYVCMYVIRTISPSSKLSMRFIWWKPFIERTYSSLSSKSALCQIFGRIFTWKRGKYIGEC
jgi:hypothetical protein